MVQAGIARLEQALGEDLSHADRGGKLTRLGEDIAVAARPLLASFDASRSTSGLGNALARQAINSVVSDYAGEAWAMPLAEPGAAFHAVEQNNFGCLIRGGFPLRDPAQDESPGTGRSRPPTMHPANGYSRKGLAYRASALNPRQRPTLQAAAAAS